ncbi:ABC transporter permease [Curtobacterium flaccumfaciens]|uniref:ABC transporter permease n=1 Tax=Curtobacterium flaccumfaciens TaxID=2035 RepID=UPI001BDE6EBA|nr:ABC transporter permease [Curtobacterium flaccumfaciens]MBT1605356.1 FtsX-like permease family protein [Curtobacterium flaccumfaciens pv. betae]MBT1655535.1 FtsX-like permease family protein [Curtobacterium flaccumfaciens pv. betae]MCS0470421.1 FtsX-like permease family protein [Curtobacterium flaccumfaciens pv. betae]MCS0473785.1 FtsX-like permease family protein [Curtobacterium flaccumfaciens pv. betae]MCS0478710.1 FtsX-like permease family protein [Curtobacterium flaccumfaciens pv. betae
MFLTYLRRELTNRKKQTVIIAIGMALAIALVVIVSSISGGVQAAQSSVLQSVYGVGTDITVTKTATASTNGGRPSFDFGSQGDSDDDSGSTNLSQSRLAVARGTSTLDAANLSTITSTDGVKAATGVLTLENSTFSGQVQQQSTDDSSSDSSSDSTTQQGPPSGDTGGGGGFGGGSFSVDSFTVTGIPVSGATVGPLTSTELTKGRTFAAKDAGKDVVVLDASYAKSESKAVGDTVDIGGTDFTVIGIVSSTGSASTTGSNTYIPLDTAQALADLDGKVTSIYVSAESSSDVSTIKSALQAKLTSATVSTEADLASSVSGSLSTASSLVSNLGKWLSIVVLAAAFLIAILFTISGVTRRTREFGTLKAIGWSNGRITRQVAGESLVQGLIGGVLGAAAGLIGILVVNVISPTISASASSTTGGGAGGGGGMPGGAATAAAGSGTTGGAPAGGFGGGASTASTTDVVLHAPVTVEIILLAIGLAILGGLIAGALGGWRASRLRPAEALRSVA